MPPSRRPQDAWKAGPKANGQPTPASPGRPAARKTGGTWRWVWAALILSAILGTIAGLFVYLRPDPAPVLLAIPVTQYAHPDWPANPWAEADARGLREHFGDDSAQAFQAQEKARVLHELSTAADGSRGVRIPRVVYLSALGVAAEGKVFLLPGDAKPDDPATWLPLDDLLAPLRRTAAPRLLILDVRSVASPRSVLPAEDVNEALGAALKKLADAGDLPFRVLSANTPCTGPVVVRPLKRTAFGLAVAQAIGGAADGWEADRVKDSRVSVEEFVAYVRETTYAASVAFGHTPAQLPTVHGKGPNFILAQIPPGGAAPLPTLPDPEPQPDWLQPAWTDRDKMLKDGLHRRSPRLTHQFTLAAARAEHRWLGGLDPKAVGDRFLPVATDLRETAKGERPPAALVKSVARARLNPATDVRAAEAALRPVFERLREPVGPKKDEMLPALMQAAWAKPADPPPFDATAAAIFDYAASLDDPTFDQMRQLAALAGGFRPRPRHPEVLAVELVAGVPPELAKRWPAGAIRAFLTTAKVSEDAAMFDGRCLPWVRDKLAEADAARWKALRTLFDPETPDRDLRTAVGELERVRQEYAAVRDAAAALVVAFAEYEETRAVLVDLAVAFPHELAGVAEAVAAAWAGRVEDVRRLRVLLRPPATVPLAELTQTLNRITNGAKPARERLKGLIRVPDPATPQQLEAALRWPRWTQPERAGYLARLDAAGRDATARLLAKWPTQPAGSEPAAPPKCSPQIAADSARDLKVMAELLRIEDLLAKVPDPGPSPSAKDAAEFARRLREVWRGTLPEQYRTADAERQAALGWLVDPDDVAAYPRPNTGGPPNPELPRQRDAEKKYHAWLGTARYPGEAATVKALENKAARDAAAALETLARDFQDWNP